MVKKTVLIIIWQRPCPRPWRSSKSTQQESLLFGAEGVDDLGFEGNDQCIGDQGPRYDLLDDLDQVS